MGDTDALTRREVEVLYLLAQGYSYKEVARMLGIRTSTVAHHAQKIIYKLDARNTAHAVYLYYGERQ